MPAIRRGLLRILPDAPVIDEGVDRDDVRGDVGACDHVAGATHCGVAAGRDGAVRAVAEGGVSAVVSTLRVADEGGVDRDEVVRSAADGILLVVPTPPPVGH